MSALTKHTPEQLQAQIHTLRHREGRARQQALRAAERERLLLAAAKTFLAKTDGIRAAGGQEDRYLARQEQHDAFVALRATVETIDTADHGERA